MEDFLELIGIAAGVVFVAFLFVVVYGNKKREYFLCSDCGSSVNYLNRGLCQECAWEKIEQEEMLEDYREMFENMGIKL